MSSSQVKDDDELRKQPIKKLELDKSGCPTNLREWEEDVRSFLTQKKCLRFLKKHSSEVAKGAMRVHAYLNRDVISLSELREKGQTLFDCLDGYPPPTGVGARISSVSLSTSPGVKVDSALLLAEQNKLTQIVDKNNDKKTVENVVDSLEDITADLLISLIKDDLSSHELRTLNELNIFMKDEKPESDWDERARMWRVISRSVESVKVQVLASVIHYDVYGLIQSVLDHFNMQSKGKIEVTLSNKLLNIRLGRKETIASFHERWCVAVKGLRDHNLLDAITDTVFIRRLVMPSPMPAVVLRAICATSSVILVCLHTKC